MLTQVFVDTGAKEVYIAVINTYLAEALDDYDDRHDEVTYAVWSVNDVTPGTASLDLVKDTDELENLDVSGEDFDITEVAEDDIALVRVADGEIQDILEPEVLSEVTITSFKQRQLDQRGRHRESPTPTPCSMTTTCWTSTTTPT